MVKHSLKKHSVSFKHAFDGIACAFSEQPNFRIHVGVAITVCLMGTLLEVSIFEWIILLFTILWVILSEMINTAMEAIVDLITTEIHQEAKTAKDVAAGAVMLGAAGSVVIGCLIFIPKIMALFL